MIERFKNETESEFIIRVCNCKDALGLTWDAIAFELNDSLGYSFSSDKYRKDYYKFLRDLRQTENTTEEECVPGEPQESVFELDSIKLEKCKLSDERIQINSLYRRISREETLIDMAKYAALEINSKFKLPDVTPVKVEKHSREAILEISDWHYGIEISNYWNAYNPDIAKTRIAKLRDEVIAIGKKEDIKVLHIVNLGDLIAGRIHLPLRVNSRFDVITQIIQVSELLAQFLNDLSHYFVINYYDTLDNHSRIEPLLKESLDLESLARITTWYLKERLPNIKYHDNKYGDDIITMDVMGHKVIGVHGHKDKPINVVENLSMMTKQHYDLVLTAHLHHFSADERNETIVISNSSLMGTDDYAEKLRLSAKPSQNLIIASETNPVEILYKIQLD